VRHPGGGGHADDVHPPGRRLQDEQHVQAGEEDRVHVEEAAGQQSAGVGAEERPPGGAQLAEEPAAGGVPAGSAPRLPQRRGSQADADARNMSPS
jgi:hypothetical protein